MLPFYHNMKLAEICKTFFPTGYKLCIWFRINVTSVAVISSRIELEIKFHTISWCHAHGQCSIKYVLIRIFTANFSRVFSATEWHSSTGTCLSIYFMYDASNKVLYLLQYITVFNGCNWSTAMQPSSHAVFNSPYIALTTMLFIPLIIGHVYYTRSAVKGIHNVVVSYIKGSPHWCHIVMTAGAKHLSVLCHQRAD